MKFDNTKYAFEYANNHPVVEIEERAFIIDTGSPISFFMDGHAGALTINGKSFSMKNNPLGIDRAGIEALVGRSVDGLLGLDMIESLNSLYMNRTERYAVFGDDGIQPLSHRLNMKKKSILGMSFLAAMIELNGSTASAIIDSGACISYIGSGLLRNREPIGAVSDYSPSFGGKIKTEKYEVELSLGGEKQTVVIAKMTSIIEGSVGMLGYNAILGFGEIRWDELLLDISGGIMSYN